jgi:hypothetical protein
MRKWIMVMVVALAAALTLNSPAQASVPDWDAVSHSSVVVVGDGWQFHPASAVQTVETPAMAAKRSAADCAALGFFFCTWKDINYTGLWWAFSQTTINSWYNYSFSFRSSPPPAGINNTGSSWVNDTTFTMYLFDDVNCDHINGLGWLRDLAPGHVATAQGSDWNDRVSAIGRNIRSDGVDC